MSGGFDLGQGSGGERQKEFELNLVPFIDLMSTCICFLLITAVWVQVSMIQIGSSIYGKKTESGQVEPPKREDVSLRVDVNAQGYIVNVGSQQVRIVKKGDQWDKAGLADYLKRVKEKYQEKTDGVISMTDELKFNELIGGMDVMMTAGFPEIAIAAQ